MNITDNEIVLKSPNGKYKVVLSAMDTCAGIWLEGPTNKDNKEAINVGLVVDHETGEPYIQFYYKGVLKRLDMNQIAEGVEFKVSQSPNLSV